MPVAASCRKTDVSVVECSMSALNAQSAILTTSNNIRKGDLLMLWKRLTLITTVFALISGPVVWAAHHEVTNPGDLAKAWERAYNTSGAAAVAAMYVEEGMRMPPDMPTVKGREAIQAQVQGGIDQGLVKVQIDSVETIEMGDLAVLRGTWKGMDAEGNGISEGKWANTLKKIDGKWFIYYDIWNMDAAAADGDNEA